MKANVGYPDRMVRAYVGVVLSSLAWLGVLGTWGWIGAPLMVSGLAGFCPLYAVFGFSTCV